MYPSTVDGVVGDISLYNGGYFPPHKSHRDGLDIDIGIYQKNNRPIKNFSKARPEEVDYEKTWDFIWALLETGQVEIIYVDYSHQANLYEAAKKEGMDEETMKALFQYPDGRGVRKGVIRHWSGHRGHLHVRFKGVPKDKEVAEIDHSMRQRLSDIRPKISSSHVRLDNEKSHLAN
jgi:hypothetical protein